MNEEREYTGIKTAYAASKNIYDTVLSQKTWWAKLYISFFWGGVKDWEIAEKISEMIPADFSGRLLDVPVGTGMFTAGMYEKLPGAEICCLDYSEDMLRQARARFSEMNLAHVTCMQGDVGALHFAAESFDIVLSMNGFHAFPDKEKAFLETARVLKPGGLFCGCFYIREQSRRTDFLVNALFTRKGWFTPPFDTAEQLQARLEQMYSKVTIQNRKAMVYFHCVK